VDVRRHDRRDLYHGDLDQVRAGTTDNILGVEVKPGPGVILFGYEQSSKNSPS
jgi:hypothetical protein